MIAGATTTVRGDDLAVRAFALDDDRDIALDEALSVLSPAEGVRMDRFVFPQDRDRYVRGRGYVRVVLGQALGCRPEDVPIKTGKRGKPDLRSEPIAFNLSHSGPHAVLGLRVGGHLGIDLEVGDHALAMDADVMDLAPSCMAPEELTVLRDLPNPERRGRFLAYWTAKEARMKLYGEGMSLDPRHIALSLHQGHPVGYLDPGPSDIELSRIDIPVPSAICHVAVDRRGD